MALVKIREYYPNYVDELFKGNDFKGYTVYAGTSNEKIGSVDDALVDEAGRIRYFVLDTGFWIFGKKVLLPVGRSRIDFNEHKLYALGLTTKDQAEALPKYDTDMKVDYDYEERVRQSYRTRQPQASYNHNNYRYENDTELFDLNDRDHGEFKLYEERLIANKDRHKAGEVVVGKAVETEKAKASVPVEKERVIVERTTPDDAGKRVTPGTANFKEGEVARMEVYEETADIHKEAYVREEVNVRKEVDRDTVTAEETLRREELRVNKDGESVVKR
ncbi:hypothetical protein M595_1094 [Lyngbya aestuarii BL J]|uniref:PRC-barrel domain protein n=1 Tax=Lyngbya aestuarii BL J TaxID=1348334 RepID=U7QNV1_9CYAN|nr:DUF2382 domain-containing protein [Lyngbya aestuarii]ERT08927.1 hypothetical protein M595_1094 [Lyngbya aestuarii BL J]